MRGKQILHFFFTLPWWGRALLLGLLCGAGFLSPVLVPVSLVALGYTFYYLDTCAERRVLQALLIFFGKAFLAVWWFFSTYPISLFGDTSAFIQLGAIAFYVGTTALWLGIGGVVYGVGVALLHLYKVSTFIRYVVAAPLWVLAELAGALVFAVATAAPGIVVLPAFSFGHSGYLFALIPGFLPLARFGGVYVLGIVGLLLLSALVLVCVERSRRALVLLAFIFGSVLLQRCLFVTPVVPSLHVLQIDTAITSVGESAQYDEEISNELNDAVTAALARQPQAIILPEGAGYLDRVYHADEVGVEAALKAFSLIHDSTPVTIIDSTRAEIGQGQVAVRATAFNGKGEYTESDKEYLVPQGEYTPLLYRGAWWLVGFGSVLKDMSTKMNYVSGEKSAVAGSSFPAVLFCFESVSPWRSFELVKKTNSPYLVHPISHAWFHAPAQLWYQLDTMLKVNAVMAGVPIVSAGNLVAGKVYLPDGTIKNGTVVQTTTHTVTKEVRLP